MRVLVLLLSTWLLTGLALPSTSQAQVWQDTETWSPAWESKFAAWVDANWNIDFFNIQKLPSGEDNIYYGLHLDCADTVYSMRLIFSAEHGLPFAIQDPTTTDKVVTNRMNRWNSLPTSAARMREFLRYVYDLASSHSLPNDTFPVPVSRDWIHSGALIRTTAVNHHSWSVKRITPFGVPYLVFNSSVTPTSTLRLQQRTSWPNPYWVFEGNFTPSSDAGFRYWRPLDSLLIPAWKVPNYSEEQFRIPLAQWEKTVQAKLALTSEADDAKVLRLYKTACEAAQTRVESVKDGVTVLRALTTQCMDADTYDNVSTPSRDHRLFDDLVALRRGYKDIIRANGGAKLSAKMASEMAHIFPQIMQPARSEIQQMRPSSNQNSLCMVKYDSGKAIDLAEVKRRMFAGLISNNPMDEMAYRWGELPGPSPAAKACQSWGVWTPDLNQAD